VAAGEVRHSALLLPLLLLLLLLLLHKCSSAGPACHGSVNMLCIAATRGLTSCTSTDLSPPSDSMV
jgi:hypothetical protein